MFKDNIWPKYCWASPLDNFGSKECFLANKLYQKTGGHMLTAKIVINRSDRSDQAVWPVWCCSWSGRSPTSLTGGSDRSDRSRRSPTVIRVLNRFISVNRISCGISPPHPINIKGHGRLGNPIDQNTKQIYYFITFTFLPRYPTFPTSICCSSLVFMAFEEAGLPSLTVCWVQQDPSAD